MTREEIDASVASVKTLVANDRSHSALLLGWATFEALASDGLITASEADVPREFSKARNQVVHGGLDQTAHPADIAKFLEISGAPRGVIEAPFPTRRLGDPEIVRM